MHLMTSPALNHGRLSYLMGKSITAIHCTVILVHVFFTIHSYFCFIFSSFCEALFSFFHYFLLFLWFLLFFVFIWRVCLFALTNWFWFPSYWAPLSLRPMTNQNKVHVHTRRLSSLLTNSKVFFLRFLLLFFFFMLFLLCVFIPST